MTKKVIFVFFTVVTVVFLLFVSMEPSVKSAPMNIVIEAARGQIGVTVAYDSAYSRITYPGGDVPMDRGVCTDVIIRAYRHAGIDLQVLVHEDMSTHWADYPGIWGLSRPDANIDHRRVPNLEVFFRRHATILPVTSDAANYQPGDIVTWRLDNGRPHIGLVSASFFGPRVIHNIGRGAREEAVLFSYRIVGHFRYTIPNNVNRAFR
ncbi:MAG: DUF1287 domain-containing protein [Methylococcales bacterium]